MDPGTEEGPGRFRHWLHEVIFEADTPLGKGFDVWLLVAIFLSVVAVMLESVQTIAPVWRARLLVAEWFFTILFTVEYGLRLYCVQRPLRYATSFFGLVDLFSILPTYLSLFFGGTQALLVIRTFRLVRVFRIYKLHQYVQETQSFIRALKATRAKISVFILGVVTTMMTLGSAMYLIEGRLEGTEFTSIPRSVYWAVVTMTTVGYGDIAPTSALGQFVASVAMLIGYSIIIVPMGIFSAEMVRSSHRIETTQACPSCGGEGHDVDASYCKYCSARL